MTKSEEMKRLEAAMASDKELYKRFYETVDRIASEDRPQSDGELFAKAAVELGYNIIAADFERLDAEREEISPDELDMVSGGEAYYEFCIKDYYCRYMYHHPQYEENVDHVTEDEYGHNAYCITAWHCTAATLHTDSKCENVVCWKDYLCNLINN